MIVFAVEPGYGKEDLRQEDPGLGISRELARSRAELYRNIHYRVSFTLRPGAEELAGEAEITLTVTALREPLVLDFKGIGDTAANINGKVRELHVNGQPFTNYRQVNGHIVIPVGALRTGENQLIINFESPARKAGAAITRYLDQDDQSEYLYTLFVPSDAHMAFPCFDQPDLKAGFTLETIVPKSWQVVTNTPIEKMQSDIQPGFKQLRFQETKPISSYLFAFAAGPFVELPVKNDALSMRIFARSSKAVHARAELDELARINREGVRVLAEYFDYAYPFTKYDMVILPEFAYGGMEHAGASFFREDRLLFPTDPTPSDLITRAELILHEAAHQWFGDLVTMRWFDDLWLKEGFATFMAYRAMERVLPQYGVWKTFYQRNKPRAYLTDSTTGTTPIFQEIPNLKDAKSAYGNIVYTKAPSILRQLEFYLGAGVFQTGVQSFLKRHAFANAEWSDLIHAYEIAAKRSLTVWADAWVKRRGLAAVAVDWQVNISNRIERLTLKQDNVLGEAQVWPMKVQLLLAYAGRAPEILTVTMEGKQTEVAAAIGKPRPDYIFANYSDYGYGRFRLDTDSLSTIKDQLPTIHDEFLRTLLWGALWDAVRDAELAPTSYIELACRTLPDERDPISVQLILANVSLAFTRYLSTTQQTTLAPKLEEMLFDRMMGSPSEGLRLTYFRSAQGIVSTPEGRQRLKQILTGQLAIPGIKIKPKDRWDIITLLLAQDDSEANTLLAAAIRNDPSDDGRRYAFIAVAARGDATVKAEYFQRYLNDSTLAENWIENSLRTFNSIRHAKLTLPYLKPALAELPNLKQHRKIFFINEWLDAFISGQDSPEALKIVEEFLQRENLDRDLKLKILETIDKLARCVKIRAKYAHTSN
ncbi:MAG: M1 family aminopeptidase [Acidobacteriota bacterium]